MGKWKVLLLIAPGILGPLSIRAELCSSSVRLCPKRFSFIAPIKLRSIQRTSNLLAPRPISELTAADGMLVPPQASN
jgi:hypothetical protein